VKNIETELTPEVGIKETEGVTEGSANNSKIIPDKILYRLSESSLEKEAKRKRKKKKSNEVNGEQINTENNTNYKDSNTKVDLTAAESISSVKSPESEPNKEEFVYKTEHNTGAVNLNRKLCESHETIQINESNSDLGVTLGETKHSTEIKSNLGVKNIEAKLTPEVGIKETDGVAAVSIIDSEIIPNKSLNHLSEPSLEKKTKRKKNKSNEVNGEQINTEDNTNYKDSNTNADLTAVESISSMKSPKSEQFKEEQANEAELNTEVVKVNRKLCESHETIQITEANSDLVVTLGETRLSTEAEITETKTNPSMKNIETELTPEVGTIESNRVVDGQNIESPITTNKSPDCLPGSSMEKETKKKKKKRKSIKSNEELDIKACTLCAILLSPSIQQNICGNCGQAFCAGCCSKSMVLSKHRAQDEVKVCDSCFEESTPANSGQRYDETLLKNSGDSRNALEAPVKNSNIAEPTEKKLQRRSYPGEDSRDDSHGRSKTSETSSDKVRRRSYVRDPTNEKRHRRRCIRESSNDNKSRPREVPNDTPDIGDIERSSEEIVNRRSAGGNSKKKPRRKSQREVEEKSEELQNITKYPENNIDMKYDKNEGWKIEAKKHDTEDKNAVCEEAFTSAPDKIEIESVDEMALSPHIKNQEQKITESPEEEIKATQNKTDAAQEITDGEQKVAEEIQENTQGDLKNTKKCAHTELKSSEMVKKKSELSKETEAKPKRITLPIIYKNKTSSDNNKKTFTIKAPQIKLRQNCFKKVVQERPKSDSDVVQNKGEASQENSEESLEDKNKKDSKKNSIKNMQEKNKRRSLNESTKSPADEEMSEDEITTETTENLDKKINKKSTDMYLKVTLDKAQILLENPQATPENAEATKEDLKKPPIKELSEDDLLKAVCEKRSQIKKLENVAQGMIDCKWKEVEKYNGARKKVEEDTEILKKELKDIDEEIKRLNERKDTIRQKCRCNKNSIVKLNESRRTFEDESCARLLANKREMSERQQELLELIMKKPLLSVANEKTKLSLLDIYDRRIEAKEREIACPVCSLTASTPIFMCPAHHLICSNCFLKVDCCPKCQASYPLGEGRRHRNADMVAEELAALVKERKEVAVGSSQEHNSGDNTANNNETIEVNGDIESHPQEEKEDQLQEITPTAENKTNGHGGAIEESAAPHQKNVVSYLNIQVPAGIPAHIAQSAAELYDREMKQMTEKEFEEFMKDWTPSSPMYLYLRELRIKVK